MTMLTRLPSAAELLTGWHLSPRPNVITSSRRSLCSARLLRRFHTNTAVGGAAFVVRNRLSSLHIRHRNAIKQPGTCLCRSTVLNAQESISSLDGGDIQVEPTERVQRLIIIVELRRLYRNCLRAANLLDSSLPVGPDELIGNSSGEGDGSDEISERAQEHQKAVFELVAEMQLTAEQLKASVKALPEGFGARVLCEKGQEGIEKGLEGERRLRSKAQMYCRALRERYSKELPGLPFPSEAAAQAAVDLRNARYQPARLAKEAEEAGASPTAISKLEQAEKVAESFVSRRIKPALKRAQERGVVDSLRQSSAYLRGLWTRLNGGGRGDMGDMLAALDLPLPTSTKRDSEVAIGLLDMRRKDAERRLVDASAARERKLRRAGPAGRIAMAVESRFLDENVAALGREVAVRSLQLEMEHIYRSLEDEALEIVRDNIDAQWHLRREGSTDELALLVAEFALLDDQLSSLAQEVPPNPLLDNLLEQMGVEVPDMRTRVGITEQDVYGGSGMSLMTMQLQAKEAQEKLAEGGGFLLRGVRLLSSDLGNVGRLFMRAAVGNSLRPREVGTLRRTFRDVLVFIPFIIILIIPLTPLGHVLIFGFIQRYFPQFFPSQFSKARQEVMMKFEMLQSQLLEAEARAEREEEQAELAKLTAILARMAPASRRTERSAVALLEEPPVVQADSGPAAREVKLLQEQVESALEDVNNGEEFEGRKGTGP